MKSRVFPTGALLLALLVMAWPAGDAFAKPVVLQFTDQALDHRAVDARDLVAGISSQSGDPDESLGGDGLPVGVGEEDPPTDQDKKGKRAGTAASWWDVLLLKLSSWQWSPR